MHEEFMIDGVKVEVFGVANFDREEAQRYIDYTRDHTNEPLRKLTITAEPDGKLQVDYELRGPKFERIRRITGYLTGTLDSWNNSKRAEERDRVKHGLDGVDKEIETAYWRQYVD